MLPEYSQSLKVWLKSVYPWLKYRIFSRGLFFYWRFVVIDCYIFLLDYHRIDCTVSVAIVQLSHSYQCLQHLLCSCQGRINA